MEPGRVSLEPFKCFSALKERIVIGFGIVETPDIEHPPGLVLRKPWRSQPFDAVTRTVLLFGFFKLFSLKLGIAKSPDDMQIHIFFLSRLFHELKSFNCFRTSQMGDAPIP